MPINTQTYQTELQVRPDDIDMFQHVHSSRYIDYVLAARYEQMERCYKMPMQEFLQHGLGWVIRNASIDYKRPLRLAEYMLVETRFEEMAKDTVKVVFRILRKENKKVCAEGYFYYTMINLQTGRAEVIPDWIIERYSQQ